MVTNHIAIDLGASGTKIISGIFDGNLLKTKKIGGFRSYHYKNKDLNWWDFNKIYNSIMNKIKAFQNKHTVDSIGFDSWGVDFGLLDKDDKLILDPLQYRSMFHAKENIEKTIEENKDYISHRVPTQYQPFNTIYQLLLFKKQFKEELSRAKTILSIPSLLAYKLAGQKYYEYTQATTTQLFNYRTNEWDIEMAKELGIPDIFPEVVGSGTIIGENNNSKIVLPATHDTASAFASVPASSGKTMIISIGTWCLNGFVVTDISNTEELIKRNYAVEGCADGRLRVIANTTGLWLFQKLRERLNSPNNPMTYEKMVKIAEEAPSFSAYIDVDDEALQKTEQMDKEIVNVAKRFSGRIPETLSGIARIALEGIALKIRKTKEDLEGLFGNKVDKVRIVGGGVKNSLLCQMVADALNLPVRAGPIDGTALGNILLQMKALKVIEDLDQGYEVLKRSFHAEKYSPKNTELWENAFNDFMNLMNR
ncbi:MAG: rhamnulokinase [Petrotogales bacterium]